MFRSLVQTGAAAILLSGCLVARPISPVPDRDALDSWGRAFPKLVPLPHGTAIAAGRYRFLQANRPVAADSFWIYQSDRGGYVLHAERADERAFRVTTWLEVDAQFRPVQGWEEMHQGDYRCRSAFRVEGEELFVFLAGGAGRDGRMRLRAPERFGIAFISPVADGWSALASTQDPLPLPVLRLGHCLLDRRPQSGLEHISFGEAEIARRSFGGREIDLLLFRRTNRQDKTIQTRDLLWVDPTTGIPARRISPHGEDAQLEWIWTLTG